MSTTILIRTGEYTGSIVHALAFGQVAVTRLYEGRYSLTHIKSGMAILSDNVVRHHGVSLLTLCRIAKSEAVQGFDFDAYFHALMTGNGDAARASAQPMVNAVRDMLRQA